MIAPPQVAAARKVVAARQTVSGTGGGKQRIGSISAFFLIATAIIFDATQFFLNFIPVLGQVAGLFITFLAATIFGIWFLLLGVNYFSGKKAGLKMIAVFGSVITELVPLVSALPAITLGVVVVIVATRLEDQGGT